MTLRTVDGPVLYRHESLSLANLNIQGQVDVEGKFSVRKHPKRVARNLHLRQFSNTELSSFLCIALEQAYSNKIQIKILVPIN